MVQNTEGSYFKRARGRCKIGHHTVMYRTSLNMYVYLQVGRKLIVRTLERHTGFNPACVPSHDRMCEYVVDTYFFKRIYKIK